MDPDPLSTRTPADRGQADGEPVGSTRRHPYEGLTLRLMRVLPPLQASDKGGTACNANAPIEEGTLLNRFSNR